MISMTRRRMVRVVEPVKGLVEERWWVIRKWRVRISVRMEVMTAIVGHCQLVVLVREGAFSDVWLQYCGIGRGTYFLWLEPRQCHATSRGGHWNSILGLETRL